MTTLPDPFTTLDLPTKVKLLSGASAFTLWPEPVIGLREVRLSDGPTGVRGLKFTGGRQVALFPNATLLASTWDEHAAYEFGRLLAQEARAQQIHVVLGPTINLHRSVLGGRLFEAFSEDPLLTGRIAAGYVRGIQDMGVAACLKHLVANESETERNTVDSVLTEATLRELYLLPFEIALTDSDAWTLMAAYNDVNGVPATEQHYVNNEIVKGEWGYRGLIMSDWFATKSAAAAANGGLDLVMPGPTGPWGDALVAAVRAGEVDEAVIDDHLARLLLLARRVGALDGDDLAADQDLAAGSADDAAAEGYPAPDSAVRRAELTRIAARGMTVLKNDGEVLPLAPAATVALIGRHAVETIGMGGGSAQVNPPHQVSVAQGLTALLGDQVRVVDGVEVRNQPTPARGGQVTDPATSQPGIRVHLYDAAGAELEQRHCPLAKTTVGMDDDFEGTAASARLTGTITAGGPVELGVLGVGTWELTVGERTRTFTLEPGQGGYGGEVIAPPAGIDRFDVEPGTLVTASVRLPGGTGIHASGTYALVCHPAPRPDSEVIDEAVRATAGADVAVVVVGLTEEQETESVDKTTLRLPGEQDALVEAVAAAAERTVVVVNAATPVLMPWLSQVDAVLWAGLPGQEGGHAVAAALVGDIEPAGRLTTTFPAADGAAPAWSVTPVDGQLAYDEGTYIGYRGHFAGRAPEPMFWLGHGLGYTSWEYGDVRRITGDAPAIAVTITNTGKRASREVVQVYLRPVERDEPVRLIGWTAAKVAAGESARVTVPTDRRMWRRWDPAAGRWGRLADGGSFLVARGLGDIRAIVS